MAPITVIPSRPATPRLVEAAVPMTSCDDGPEFHYRFGVDLFIAGVRALAPAHPAEGT